MAHIAALRAHSGALPVGVTVFVEGEEEIGSDSLGTILERHGEKMRADAIVLADSTNWAVGEPVLTTTLRGMIRIVLTVRALDHGIQRHVRWRGPGRDHGDGQDDRHTA